MFRGINAYAADEVQQSRANASTFLDSGDASVLFCSINASSEETKALELLSPPCE